MNTRLVYVAMPIDMAESDIPFIEFAVGDLKASQHVVYRPDRSFQMAKGVTPSAVIQNVNNAAIKEAAGMLAFLPKAVRSVGVPMEIQAAIALGKPVVVVTDNSESWVVAGWSVHPLVQVVEFNASQIRAGVAWMNRMIEENPVTKNLAQPVVFEAKVEGAQLPTRAYETDAGFDLYVSKDTYIPAGGFADVPCGVAMQIDPGEWAFITGRSSTIRKKRLRVENGVIDAGFSGELFAGVYNLNDHAVTVPQGERVAQIILLGASACGREAQFGKIADAPRGNNGFGSSGR